MGSMDSFSLGHPNMPLPFDLNCAHVANKSLVTDEHIILKVHSFLFLRKISPELTSAANPPLLYMRNAYHSMACQAMPYPHLGSELVNPGLLKQNMQT